jgi:hypothetical protein
VRGKTNNRDEILRSVQASVFSNKCTNVMQSVNNFEVRTGIFD